MAKCMVVEGKYQFKQLATSTKVVGVVTGFGKLTPINKSTVKNIELITEEHSKSASSGVARGIVGGALLGPVGLIGGALSAKNKGSYHLIVEWNDGETSLIKVDQKGYAALKMEFR